KSLFELYPNARINYFEHGIGDYFLIQEVDVSKFSFYCIFNESLKKFLTAKGLPNNYVKGYLEEGDFQAIATEVINTDDKKEEIFSYAKIAGRKVLILL